MYNLQKFEYAVPMGSLESYIHWANKIPMLSAEEERELAVKYREDGDLNAAKQLVMSHLRFVISVARNYTGYGLAHSDLIQEGSIGLMKAVKRFDPDHGVRLVSFAVHWVKAEIHEFVLKNWRIVKVATTKAQRKLFFNLRKASQDIKSKWLNNEKVSEIAENLNVSEPEVRRMESRLRATDSSFDTPISVDAEWSSPANSIEDARYNPAHHIEQNDWSKQREDSLHLAVSSLDERSQDIVTQRWLVDDDNKATLHDLAAKYSVSAERIRQIETNAMKKIKAAVTS